MSLPWQFLASVSPPANIKEMCTQWFKEPALYKEEQEESRASRVVLVVKNPPVRAGDKRLGFYP